MEPDLQVKLLKTIESKKIRRIGSEKEIKMDFRVVAATNEDPFELLRQGRSWSFANMDVILDLTAHGCPLNRDELAFYYSKGLVYSLGEEEQRGLMLFYEKLAAAGIRPPAPPLEFFRL